MYEQQGYTVEVRKLRKQPLPQWYLDEPEPLPGYERYLKIFWELSTERQVGFSVGQIPVSKVEEYCIRRGYSIRTVEILKYVIRSLDSAYLTWITEKRKKESKRSG